MIALGYFRRSFEEIVDNFDRDKGIFKRTKTNKI